MKNIAPLQKQAIEAAKQENWQLAIELNQTILKEHPDNINALNRLALAMMQLNQPAEAKKILQKVLTVDKHNKIAQKNLLHAKRKQRGKVAQFHQAANCIEEPGKARIIELIRLTDKKFLRQHRAGQECILDPKKTFVSVNSIQDNNYLGSLPQDISKRLIQLIKNGNQYCCSIHSIDTTTPYCKVHVKETYTSEINKGITSFPTSLDNLVDDPDELAVAYSVNDDIPLEILSDEDDDGAEVCLDERNENLLNDDLTDESEE